MDQEYRITGLVCCRGGSKGIPGKNIRAFCGKPLLGWLLDAARESGVFDEVILSTDSEEIAAVGRDYGASVPSLRPVHLAQDTSNQFETHSYLFNTEGITDATHRVCILNNNPFVDAELIREGFDQARGGGWDRIVLDCMRIGGDYAYHRQCFEDGGVLRFLFPWAMLQSGINRQTVGPYYTSINNTRWGKPSLFSSYDAYKEEVVRNGFLPIWLGKMRNFDIDDADDWQIAESVFGGRQSQ